MRPPFVLKNRLKKVIKSSPILYIVYLFISGKGKYISYLPINRNYSFCIEGFPSSANSYCYNILKVTQPGSLIAHHTHTVASIKLALKNSVPIFFVVRHPLDAIMSTLVRKHGDNALTTSLCRGYILEYIDIYSFILKHSDRVLLLEFEKLFSLSDWLPSAESYLGVRFECTDYEELDARVKHDMTEWYRKYDVHVDGVPLPGHKRVSDRKLAKRLLMSLKELDVAIEKYEMLLQTQNYKQESVDGS